MSIQRLLCATIALSMALAAQVMAQSERVDLSLTHYGGCILLEPVAEAPDELYSNSGVVASDRYKPFNKEVIVNGYALAGRDDISDEFMEQVAKVVVEMFPRGEGIDAELQESVIRNMYEYGALIPFYKGRSRIESEEDRAAWQVTRSKNSVCDVIMEAPGRGQVMEVVEHLLHYVNDVGLHYTFPDQWGLTTESELYKYMQECIEKKYYNLREDIAERPSDRRVRGSMQEFGYWVITTAWNLQEPYGPHIDEWTIKDAEDMQEKMPEMYEMFQQTIDKVMVSPSIDTLEEFNDN